MSGGVREAPGVRGRGTGSSQGGQALLLALVAVAVFGFLATVFTALWVQSVTVAQRRAQATTALYAAEVGLAAGLERIFQGDARFISGSVPISGQAGGGAYQVIVSRERAGSSSAIALVSTGWPTTRPQVRRTVRLLVDSPFFRPVVAGKDLRLVWDCGLLCGEVPRSAVFNPDALYGGSLVAGSRTTGVTQGTVSWPDLSYAAFASRVPNPAQPVSLGGGLCQIAVSGWYRVNKCSSLEVHAPWAGIDGDLRLERLTVNQGSVLVVAGDVDLTNAEWLNAEGAQGAGVIVAGGTIHIQTLDLIRWGASDAVTLLALDTNTPDCLPPLPGCTYDPKNPGKAADRSNRITLDTFSLASGSNVTSVVAYAAPFRIPPGPESEPAIEIDVTNLLISFGETVFRGALVSASDVTVRDETTISMAEWSFVADPSLVGPLFRLAAGVPGSGVLTQISWSEEGGGGA